MLLGGFYFTFKNPRDCWAHKESLIQIKSESFWRELFSLIPDVFSSIIFSSGLRGCLGLIPLTHLISDFSFKKHIFLFIFVHTQCNLWAF